MAEHKAGVAAGTMVLGAEVANPAALLEKLLDHPNENPEAAGYGLPRLLALIVIRPYPFAQVQRNRLHAPSLLFPEQTAIGLLVCSSIGFQRRNLCRQANNQWNPSPSWNLFGGHLPNDNC